MSTRRQESLGASDSATAEAELATAQAAPLESFLTALSTYVAAIQGVADPSNAATTALTSAIATLQGHPIDDIDLELRAEERA